ncbi:MAG TPA: PAS domain S-box protein [Rudaea sp.]|nr:PAS domain S-box protein [Rudaea sp.]
MLPANAFRFSPSLVAVLDAADGTIVDVNPAFEQLLGISRAEAIGKRTVELGVWPRLETRAAIWMRIRSEQRVPGDVVAMRARDGRILHGRLYAELFEASGRSCIFAVIQDIAEGDGAAQRAREQAAIDSYRSLFDAAVEGIYRSLPAGGFIDVNPALALMFGYATPAEMLTAPFKNPAEWYVDPARALELFEQLDRDGRVVNAVSRVYRRDGSMIWISENMRAIRDVDGHVAFYEGTAVDISERVTAEARLRQSEELYKTLVDNCRDGVFLIQRGKVLFANKALADILGYELDELPSDYMDAVAAQSLAAQSERRAAREAGSPAAHDFEICLRHRNGSLRLVRVRSAPVEYEGGIASTGTMHDITDLRREQEAIAAAEHKYRSLFQNAVTGMFQSHPDGRLLEANDAIARMLGYVDSDDMKAHVRHMNQVYARPQDRARMVERLLAEGHVAGFEFPARHRDGSEVLVDLNAQLVRDERGDVLYIEGSAQDVTARRLAERALQRSELRYRTLVEHSQVGVYMMLDDRYIYVNHAFAEMFGYAEHELVGANFRVLVPDESRPHQEERYQRQVLGRGKRGDYDVTLMRKDGRRIEVVVSAGTIEMDGRTYTTGTIRDVTEQRQGQRQLEHNATHDLLTGLPNRLFFEQELAAAITASRASGNCDYAVLFLDLDGFKIVNDSLGHASGDQLLVHIADTLRRDLGDRALVARYGGDEFTLLPHGPCTRARAEQLAQRVLTLLGGSFDINGHRVFSGASLGVVLGHADYESPDQILRDADTAMYRAKARGKSAYVIFDEAMHAAARARLKIETDLRFALERGEFRVYYQPIVDLRNGLVQGCEALVRWQHPERGLLLPAEFLGVAEEAGLIVALDWWVLETTCRNLSRWQRRYPSHARLSASVNMNERQFTDRDLLGSLANVLRRSGLDPACLALEITETIFRGGRDEAQATLRQLKGLGVSLVVDDFGTGYSSLDSFATSSFDALKVDHSFVRDMVTNFRHRAIVRTITGFAEDLGLRLIAEGIETEEQAALLRDLGCTAAQGYLYAPALSVEDMERVLEFGLGPADRSRTDAVA